MPLRPLAVTATLLTATLLAATPVAAAAAAETYRFDQGHTEVLFSWEHAGITTQSAEFLDLDGTIEIDRADLAASVVDVTIDPASVHTGVADFDAHLRSNDFFAVEAHPEIRFVATGVRRVGAERAFIDGELTIKAITRPVTLDTVLTFDGPHPLGEFMESYEADYLGFHATTTVLRSAWDLGAFAPLTSDAVEITIRTELRRVDNES